MKYPLAFVLGTDMTLCSFAAHDVTEYALQQQTKVTTS